MTTHFFSVKFPQDIDLALKSATHLGVVAHPDDLEIACAHGILEGLKPGQSFFGVVCTDGAGGGVVPQSIPSKGPSLNLAQVRWQEQIEAATQGQYGGVVGLAHNSSDIRHGFHAPFLQSLKNLLHKTQPKVVYTHNPFDGHATHRAVFWHLLRALRESTHCPLQFFGVEVWRSLDWLSPQERVTLPIEDPGKIAQLIGCHHSQLIEKNFVQATLARWQAHSTFLDTQKDQSAEHVCLALDLTELLRKPQIPLAQYLEERLQGFHRQVQGEHAEFLGSLI